MSLQKNNDRIYFEDFCETARKVAFSMGSLFVESLNSEKLTEKERTKRISLEIKQVIDEIKSFERPAYFLNRSNTLNLYELFKSKGLLSNTEELNKLQLAMILSERYLQMLLILGNADLMKKTVDNKRHDLAHIGFFSKEQKTRCFPGQNNIPPMMMSPLAEVRNKTYYYEFHDCTETLKPVVNMLYDCIHIVLSPTSVDDFIKAITCHDWGNLKVKIYVGCQTNELKCVIDCFKPFNRDLTYAHIEKYGIFFSLKGIPITAHCLSSSTYGKLTTKSDIENIISRYI